MALQRSTAWRRSMAGDERECARPGASALHPDIVTGAHAACRALHSRQKHPRKSLVLCLLWASLRQRERATFFCILELNNAPVDGGPVRVAGVGVAASLSLWSGSAVVPLCRHNWRRCTWHNQVLCSVCQPRLATLSVRRSLLHGCDCLAARLCDAIVCAACCTVAIAIAVARSNYVCAAPMFAKRPCLRRCCLSPGGRGLGGEGLNKARCRRCSLSRVTRAWCLRLL